MLCSDSSRTVLHSDDYFAPVAFVVIEACHLEDKEPPSPFMLASKLPPPELLPSSFALPAPLATKTAATLASVSDEEKQVLIPAAGKFRDQLQLSGVTCSTTAGESLSLADEMADIIGQVEATLRQEAMTLDDVCFVHLYVNNMSAFGAINAEYCRYFGQYLPPSRSCVEVASISPTRVLMDCFALRGSGVSKRRQQRVMRDVLHVKSISCWAPHCIGPYSQANTLHRSLILLAGQIALLPQTMALIGPNHESQGKQSFLNACRALEALDSNLRHVCSAVIYTTRSETEDAKMDAIREYSRKELRNNADLLDVYENAYDSDESDEDVDKNEQLRALVAHAPLLVIQVSHLPRSALIEVELQALTHKVIKHLSPHSSKDSGTIGEVAFQSERTVIDRAMCLSVTTARCTASSSSMLALTQVQALANALWGATTVGLKDASLPWDRVFHARIFYVATLFSSELEIAKALKETYMRAAGSDVVFPALTFVPVERIQDHAHIAVQVLAQDLDKLETELWLRKQI